MKRIPVIVVLCALSLCPGCRERQDMAKGSRAGNPLLESFDTPFGVPPFDRIRPEHFLPAFAEGMKQQNAAIAAIVSDPAEPTWANTVEALFNSDDLLNRVSSVFDNLTSANTSAALQEISEEIKPRLSSHEDAITLNPQLFARIKAVYERKDRPDLDPAQSYLLDRLYRSFVLDGALLPADRQEELRSINRELASLAVRFDSNLLAETNAFRLVIDNTADLAGLPDAVIATAAEAAAGDSLPGRWVFTTQKPSMIPFLTYARNRELRRELYAAYTNRGNNDNPQDNKAVLARMIELRATKAQLLGFPTYAAYRLETRMAKTPERAFALLNSLWEKSLKVAGSEAAELQTIIDGEGGGFKLASWDWMYYAEKLHKAKYDLDENETRPYFPLANVREGLFTVANRLYGLTFTPLPDLPRPHPDAEAYEVREADGRHLGVLYLDYFPRESKEGGAWCLEYRGHHFRDGREITPITTVVCNLTRPAGDTPALLSMDDTETLFHEFGHALESLLSRAPCATSYVAMDFVELPSQIMEHWAFHPDALKLYARHYRTGEVIPQNLVDRIRNATLFNQGFATTEYLAASLLDLEYHSLPAGRPVDVAKFEQDVFNRYGLMPEIVSRYRSTYFGHITGSYDAGYYSYIWAAVLDNDAFDLFNANGIFDPATAASFRRNILERDGVADPMEMFVSFRGREPAVEPLLKARGLM
ncbi:MAG: M3 family metallopeptidase [Candidatus Krumholzibacteriia bacterium]